jgi:hypothetical protein
MEASCVDNKVHDLTAFEDSIRAHLANDQGCGEISVVSTGEPSGVYWDLLIDYNSRAVRLIKVHDPANFWFYTESGPAPALAEKICSTIKRRGTRETPISNSALRGLP